MPEIRYEDLEGVITEAEKSGPRPVYLLHGDEFLYKLAFRRLLDRLVLPREQDLNYEALDGDRAEMGDVIARLNTFPLLPGSKVIALHDTNLFYSKVSVHDLLIKSKRAFEKEDLKRSARYFVTMLAMADLTLDDVGHGEWEVSLSRALGKGAHAHEGTVGPWIGEVIDHCLAEGVGTPAQREDADLLAEALSRGFPESNHLILTAEFIDKRRRLYKVIQRTGVVVDCSIAQGDRAVEKRQQKETLMGYMTGALARAGKTMTPEGFDALYQKTGSSLRNFSNELEKLITFVGDGEEISAEDVNKASDKTREDPIYELTNAIGERDSKKALLLVESLLKAELFPLQILAAAINQVRKLLVARDFMERPPGRSWHRGMGYGDFQKTLFKELEHVEGGSLISKAHPFAVYKTFAQADNYRLDDLAEALEALLDADIRLKTSGQDPKLVLERVILAICGPCGTPSDRQRVFGHAGSH
ncbi:MAG: DNA polymerase III subunit delta [Thermodesulfobacteriota bacterium]|nr:DNA polymerase III subunit delta [Thermodesulfobacteriota bacterium]